VAGATGYIGRHLCNHFANKNFEVWALSRDQQQAHNKIANLTRSFEWQPEAGPPTANSLEDVDVVINMIGEPLTGIWTPGKRRAIKLSRQLGTRNLVAGIAAVKNRPKVLVSASAVGFYGDQGNTSLSEESAPGDTFLAEICTVWEDEARQAEELGLRVARLRLAPVIGRRSGLMKSVLPPFRVGLGGRIGSGQQWWPWLHIKDLVEAVDCILDREITGPVNMTAPGVVMQTDFAKALGLVLQRPTLTRIPAFAIAITLRGLADELLASRKVVPTKLQNAGYEFRFGNLMSALRDTVHSSSET